MSSMPVRLKFTRHAQDRIQERGIDADHIKKAIFHPSFTKNVNGGKIQVRTVLEDGRDIEVIYSKEGFRNSNDVLIITAYYL